VGGLVIDFSPLWEAQEKYFKDPKWVAGMRAVLEYQRIRLRSPRPEWTIGLVPAVSCGIEPVLAPYYVRRIKGAILPTHAAPAFVVNPPNGLVVEGLPVEDFRADELEFILRQKKAAIETVFHNQSSTIDKKDDDPTDPGVGPFDHPRHSIEVPFPRITGDLEKGSRCYFCARSAEGYFERDLADAGKGILICIPCLETHLNLELEGSDGRLRQVLVTP
jgi:hypothetical protein